MKIQSVLLVAGLSASVSSCSSTFTYVPIIPNPPNMEMAQAQCQMMSSGTQQGMVAWGSPSYVAGASLGNALGNAVRADQFVQQCMTMQGWRRVAVSETSSPTVAVRRTPPPTHTSAGKPYKMSGAFPPAPK